MDARPLDANLFGKQLGMNGSRPAIDKCFYGLGVFCLTVAIVLIGKPVLAPLALGCILAFVLTPIVRSLEARGWGRGTSVGLTVSLVLIVAAALSVAFATQVSQLAAELPSHSQEIESKVARLRQAVPFLPDRVWNTLDDVTGKASDATKPEDETAKVETRFLNGLFIERYLIVERDQGSSWLDVLPWVVLPMLEPLGTAALALVLAVFMTAKRDDLRNRLLAILGRARLSQTTQLLSDSSYRLSRYLLGLVAVNLGFAVAFAIGLFLIGVPYVALWGCVAFFFRFIPWVGTALSMLLPLAVSIATQHGWWPPLAVAALYGALEFTTGNFVEPWLFGRSVGMNVIAVLVAIVFWTWAWGLVGLLLATPLTLMLVTLGRHFPCFGWLNLLLGDSHPLPLHVAFYQRILAKDGVESVAMLTAAQQQSGHAVAMQSLILASLAHADREFRRGAINKSQYQELVDEANRLSERLILDAEQPVSGEAQTTIATVAEEVAETAEPIEPTKVTAFSLGDDRGLQAIRVLFATKPSMEVSIEHQPLTLKLAKKCVAEHVEIVVLSVADRQGRARLESACRMLRRCGYEGWIAAGWWRQHGIAERYRRQLKEAGADYVTHRVYAMDRMLNYVEKKQAQHREPNVDVTITTRVQTVLSNA